MVARIRSSLEGDGYLPGKCQSTNTAVPFVAPPNLFAVCVTRPCISTQSRFDYDLQPPIRAQIGPRELFGEAHEELLTSLVGTHCRAFATTASIFLLMCHGRTKLGDGVRQIRIEAKPTSKGQAQ